MDVEVGLLLSEQVKAHLSLGRPVSTGIKRRHEPGPFEQICKRACVRDIETPILQCSPAWVQEAIDIDTSEFHIQDQHGFFTNVDETVTVKKVRRRIRQKASLHQMRF
ncbi:hypothetical protein SLA2020_476080 [Shorea laevis]